MKKLILLILFSIGLISNEKINAQSPVPLFGYGVADYIPRWTGYKTQLRSSIYNPAGTANIGINTTTLTTPLSTTALFTAASASTYKLQYRDSSLWLYNALGTARLAIGSAGAVKIGSYSNDKLQLTVEDTAEVTINTNKIINLRYLPTSKSGLTSGDLWDSLSFVKRIR